MSRLTLQPRLCVAWCGCDFSNRRSTLVVNSAHRLLPLSSNRSIHVSARATLVVKSEGRPSLCDVFLTFRCLKSRTVVSWGRRILSSAELSLPNGSPGLPGPVLAGRWPGTLRNPILDGCPKTLHFLYISFCGFGILSSGGSRSTLAAPGEGQNADSMVVFDMGGLFLMTVWWSLRNLGFFQ